MGILDFVFGIVLVSVLGSLGLVALAIWGISRLVRSVSRRLHGETKERPEIPGTARDHARPQVGRKAAAESSVPVGHASVRSDYEYFDIDAGATPERISRAMRSYADDGVVGPYARDVMDALDGVAFRRQTLLPEIDNKFERSSLSWERFAATANAALDAIVRNCALLANRVQSFDVADYRRIARYYTNGGMHDNARLQRWKLLQETKSEMDGLRTANEGLLLELGKLASELGKLSSAESTDNSVRIYEEVSRLVDETRYYR